MGKYAEISMQTKKNLIDAFWGLYESKQIEKITVKEITVRAGYNRGTFYEYFLDVYDALEQLEDSLLPDLEKMPPLSLDPQQLLLSIDPYLKLFDANSKYYMILLGDHGDPSFATKIKDNMKNKLVQALPISDEQDKLDYALEFVLSAMIGTLAYWYRRGQDVSREKLMLLIANFMSQGVSGLIPDVWASFNLSAHDCHQPFERA